MLPGLKKRGINFADIVLYVAIALKHWRLMVLLMFLSLTTGLVYYVYAKPVYSARSLIRYQAIERPMDAGSLYKDSNERELAGRMTANHVIQRTARRLGLADNPKIMYTQYLKAAPIIRFNSEHNLEVVVQAYSGRIVRNWTEAMLDEFIKDRDEKRKRWRDGIIDSYTAEMKEMAEKMDQALNTKYAAQSGILISNKIKLDQLRELPREITTTTERLETLERIKSALDDTNRDAVSRLSLLTAILKNTTLHQGDLVRSDENNKAPTVVVLEPVVSEKRWENLQREQEQLKLAVTEASKTFLPAHPKMAALNKKYDEVTKALEAELRAAQNNYNLEYASLVEKKRALTAKLPEYEKANQENDQLLNEMKRNSATNLNWDTWYKPMAEKLSAIDFGADKERVFLQFMGHLELRDQVPISPNRQKLLLFAFGFGLLLAIGIPFLIEFLDHTVTNVEEMEQNHRLRGLGIVPRLEANQLPGFPAVDGHPDRQLIENFRVIRTNLLSMGAVTRNPQAIVIASAMPEEGKTVVSYNLAQSFAFMGEKTILIDADLRRGRLHRVFNMRSAPGLSNILMQNLNWRDVIRPTDKENLTVLTCGKHLDGATELIGSPVFEKLLAELRQEYKRIIIDTPPVLGLSETSMLQRLVDGVVLVVWCGRTPARYVKSAVEILQANHANFYGFVLNRLDLSVTSNYYNYYNYYYYSYHYYKSYKTLENQPPADPVEQP